MVMMLFVLLVSVSIVSSARPAFGVNFACFGKRNFGKERAKQLIDKDGKEGDIDDDVAAARHTRRKACHTERNARLRQQRDAEVVDDVVVAFRHLSANISA